MTRNYGRAPRGQRVNEATPQGRWQILTMLAALTARGLEAPMTIAEATDGDIFLAYLEQVLCPRLRPGQGTHCRCARSRRSRGSRGNYKL